jgi:DNA-binding LacI/PurR family transcriptional regulator
MSISNVAQLAGVSTATVSRVLNERPNVAPSTVANVQRAIRELGFASTRRNRMSRPLRLDGLKTATIAFMVFGTSGSRPAPAFENLLRGVSEQSARKDLSLLFSFISDPSQIPQRITERRIHGLLLHGERPSPEVQARLQTLPTVWLMANPQRPAWGDQVMPDNSAIGEMAAKYLLRRGHRRLAYLGTRASWSLEIRSLAFAHAAREAGAEIEIIQTPEEKGADFWQRDGLGTAVASLADQLAKIRHRPTGVFIAEDRLVPLVEAAMRLHGTRDGNGNGNGGHESSETVDIISCNNERRHFAGLKVVPATIDIRADAIGRLGVERLIERLRRPDLPERIRCMVEPTLVESES